MSIVERTVVKPYQARALVASTKALLESLAKLPTLAPDDTPARLVEIVPKYAALLKTVNEIVDRRDFLPPGNVVVVYGPEVDQILEGIEASFYMKQVDKLAAVLCDLGNRWGWGGYVRPDRGVDAERMMADVDRFTGPSVGPNDLTRIEGALNVFLRHHVDLSHLTREIASEVPPPPRYGPGSRLLHDGLAPILPAGQKEKTHDRILDYDEKTWRDVAGWERYPLDRPYAFVPTGDGDDCYIARFEGEFWRISGPAHEMRMLLRSPEGGYFFLGAPWRQWYVDKMKCTDGTGHFVLSNDPRDFFHGEMSLLTPSTRRIVEVDKVQALRVLTESGYESPPPDLEELLKEATSSPAPAPPMPARRGLEGMADLHRKLHPKAALPPTFLDFMEGREDAAYQDLAIHVHGNSQTSDVAIRALVHRVNLFLEMHEVSIRFVVGSSRVVKVTPTE